MAMKNTQLIRVIAKSLEFKIEVSLLAGGRGFYRALTYSNSRAGHVEPIAKAFYLRVSTQTQMS